MCYDYMLHDSEVHGAGIVHTLLIPFPFFGGEGGGAEAAFAPLEGGGGGGGGGAPFTPGLGGGGGGGGGGAPFDCGLGGGGGGGGGGAPAHIFSNLVHRANEALACMLASPGK